MSRARRTFLVLCAAAAILAMSPTSPTSPTPRAYAATTAPHYVRTIGHAGHAAMYPSGVDVDGSGNVVVADTGNDRVQFFRAGSKSPSWSVGVRGGTVGGSPNTFQNPRDVAVAGKRVYVADTDHNTVQVLRKSDGHFVTRIDFSFSTPLGVSVGTDGAGHKRILVSNGGSGAVDVFDASLHHVLTVRALTANAGTRDAATDADGNIYAADYRNDRIAKFSKNGSLLTTWGGPSAAACKKVPGPYGVDVDAAGHVYVASSDLSVVKEFGPGGRCIKTFGTKGTGAKELQQLRRVAVGPGTKPLVFAADLWGLKVLAYTQSGALSTSQPKLGTGVYPGAGGLNEPHDVTVSSTRVFVIDTVNQRVQRFDLDGTSPITWGGKGVAESSASFNWAMGIGYNPASNHVWVANTRNNRLDEFGTNGSGPLRTFGQRVGSSFNWPSDVVFGAGSSMFVADTSNDRIQAFSVTSTGITHQWTTGTSGSGAGNFQQPAAIAYDGTTATPRILVADTKNSRIVALNAQTGAWQGALPIQSGTAPGRIRQPRGIAVAGGGGIWVADTGNDRIQKFTSGGAFANELIGSHGSSNAQFNSPQGLDFASGLLYIADVFNDRIQVFNP